MFILFSWATWILLSFVALTLYLISKDNKDGRKLPPGPKSWPIIGSIPYMAKFDNILEAFQAIGDEFGDIASLKLGSIESFVISGCKNFKDILITRAGDFDGRPNFKRFNMLFEGNKNNSLAFADWTGNQKQRRRIVSHHSLAKRGSALFESFDKISADKIENKLMKGLESEAANQGPEGIYLKKILQDTCMEIFLKYFCSTDIDSTNREEFEEVVQSFDEIFTEINNECVADLFPALMPFANKSHLHKFGVPIRKFMMKHCVEPRLKKAAAKLDSNNNNNNDDETEHNSPADLLDEFLAAVGKYEDATLDNSLFAVEDLLGGATAVSSFIIQTIAFLTQNPQVQERLREEVEAASDSNGNISLENHSLPYAEAIFWEATRKIGSPIVPHVASVDTTIGEYTVKKGTVMFFNIGEFNNSPKYWNNPEEFNPERFLRDGKVSKPEFFIPFGTGRRSCLGYRLAINLGVLIVSNISKYYQLSPVSNENYKLKAGSLAVPGEGFKINLTPVV